MKYRITRTYHYDFQRKIISEFVLTFFKNIKIKTEKKYLFNFSFPNLNLENLINSTFESYQSVSKLFKPQIVFLTSTTKE